ncbi:MULTISPECIES: hypothetical protein [unclassified Rickettsia]|uniref:hypothetical protein n=1 Tax=unclassified Rickettsia TaxID=114295 RepID=UPI003132E34C
MFNVKIDGTNFYKLHNIDKHDLTRAFFQGEVEFNFKLIIEYYRKNKHFNNIYQKIYEDLTAWNIYYEPHETQTFKEELIMKQGFLPFSYEGKNLIALCRDLNDGWFHCYETQLERYAQQVTKKSTEVYNDKVFYLNSYR